LAHRCPFQNHHHLFVSFICNIFNDTISHSQKTEFSDWITVHNDRKGCELKVIFYLFLEGLRKIMKILSQVVSLYSSQDSNLALPECKSEVLLIESCSSGTVRVIQTLAFKLYWHKFFTYIFHFYGRHRQQSSSDPDRNPWAHMEPCLTPCFQVQNTGYDQICHKLGQLPRNAEDCSNSKLYHSLRHCAHSLPSHQNESGQVAQGLHLQKPGLPPTLAGC